MAPRQAAAGGAAVRRRSLRCPPNERDDAYVRRGAVVSLADSLAVGARRTAPRRRVGIWWLIEHWRRRRGARRRAISISSRSPRRRSTAGPDDRGAVPHHARRRRVVHPRPKPRCAILSLAAFLAFRAEVRPRGARQRRRSRAPRRSAVLPDQQDGRRLRRLPRSDVGDRPRRRSALHRARRLRQAVRLLGDFKLDRDAAAAAEAIRRCSTGEAVLRARRRPADGGAAAHRGRRGHPLGVGERQAAADDAGRVRLRRRPPSAKKFKDGPGARLRRAEGKTACAEVGILALNAADVRRRQQRLTAYGKVRRATRRPHRPRASCALRAVASLALATLAACAPIRTMKVPRWPAGRPSIRLAGLPTSSRR